MIPRSTLSREHRPMPNGPAGWLELQPARTSIRREIGRAILTIIGFSCFCICMVMVAALGASR